MGRRGPPAKAGSTRSTAAAQKPHNAEALILRNPPDPPEALGVTASAYWRRVAPLCHELGRLAASDLPALEILCATYAEYDAAAKIADDPEACYIINPDTGGVYAHPAVYRKQAAFKSLKDLLARFGLTPMDRGTLGVAIADGPRKQGLMAFAATRDQLPATSPEPSGEPRVSRETRDAKRTSRKKASRKSRP